MPFCTECGTNLPDGLRFCTVCGKAVEAAPAPQAAAVPPPQAVAASPQPVVAAPQVMAAAPAAPRPAAPPAQAAPPPAVLPPSERYAAARAAPPKGGKYGVMGVGAYFGCMLLFCIPVIGWVACVVMAFSGANQNRKNFARAMLIFIVIGIALSVALYFVSAWVLEVLVEHYVTFLY